MTFSPATRRAHVARRNSEGYRLHDYLLVAHDPTLTTTVAQTGSSPLCSPNGIRTRVATLRECFGTSKLQLLSQVAPGKSTFQFRPVCACPSESAEWMDKRMDKTDLAPGGERRGHPHL
jgi:hypothetical protein